MAATTNVAALVTAVNARQFDPEHTMRLASNFYSRHFLPSADYERLEMISRLENEKKNIKNKYHANIYQMLIYLASKRDKSKAPSLFKPALKYSSGFKPVDKDLLKYNAVVSEHEFQ